MDFLIHHMLRTSTSRFPDKEALVHNDKRLIYSDLERQVSGFACGLRNAGVERLDRIGVFLNPSIEQAVSILGISKAGGVFVPIHHSLFPDQVDHIINDCSIKGLITDKSKLSGLKSIINNITSLEFIVVLNDGKSSDIKRRAYNFEELCEMTPLQPWRDVGIEKDLAAILYTSGSTGKPKGVMLSHANIMAGASIVSTYLEITDSDRTLAALPFSFDAGLNQLMTTIQQSGTLVLINFLFADDIVWMLRKESITALAGVPTLWSLLAHSAALHQNHLPYLRYITNTGGALPQNVLASLRKRLPTTKIYLMYGLTEAFRSTYLPPEELDFRPTSMGMAIPNTEILVINDNGKRCRPGEVGELVHYGPTVSLGYWGDPELTSRVLRPYPFPLPGLIENGKACYSGDLVKMDEDGFLYFIGRRDNLIKSSGFRVSPSEVEDVLCQSGMLLEAAVIGIPDDVLGQRIKAFVVAKNGKLLDSDALLAFCADKMPKYMIPKSVEVLKCLSKTTSGKVDYPELRRRESQNTT